MPASSTVTKRVLLVERAGGPLLSLNDYCELQGIDAVRAPDARAVSALLRDMRRMSAIVINAESLRGDVLSLVAPIKEQHPDLPILWFAETTTPTKLPRKVEPGSRPEEGSGGALRCAARERLHELVRQQIYCSL